jgi:hypothetical protein
MGASKSRHEELWEKPKREDYSISPHLDIPDHMALPMTKKQYDIILHTSKSIRQHGNQFEILLKVKCIF